MQGRFLPNCLTDITLEAGIIGTDGGLSFSTSCNFKVIGLGVFFTLCFSSKTFLSGSLVCLFPYKTGALSGQGRAELLLSLQLPAGARHTEARKWL